MCNFNALKQVFAYGSMLVENKYVFSLKPDTYVLLLCLSFNCKYIPLVIYFNLMIMLLDKTVVADKYNDVTCFLGF